MFRQRRQREQSVPNPIADMEQFYLNQYFGSQANSFAPHPAAHPYANQTSDRFPPLEFARMHQLELRITRIEQYLGLTAAKPGSDSVIR